MPACIPADAQRRPSLKLNSPVGFRLVVKRSEHRNSSSALVFTPTVAVLRWWQLSLSCFWVALPRRTSLGLIGLAVHPRQRPVAFALQAPVPGRVNRVETPGSAFGHERQVLRGSGSGLDGLALMFSCGHSPSNETSASGSEDVRHEPVEPRVARALVFFPLGIAGGPRDVETEAITWRAHHHRVEPS